MNRPYTVPRSFRLRLVCRLTACALAFCCFALSSRGQWVTQEIELNDGWNAIFLHVQPEPADCEAVVNRLLSLACVFLLLLGLVPSSASATDDRPNVLFIAIDDLNHWVRHLGRNPQAKTPNIDRLASMGVTFERAYCAVPACEPSRAALMGGRRPWTSGCYKNGDGWKSFQKPGEGLSAQFLKAG